VAGEHRTTEARVADPAETGRAADAALSPTAAMDEVRRAVMGWPGATEHEHRFGGIEFRVGRRELGHLHQTFADLPFPRRVRDKVIAAGRARPHHVLPDSGWVTAPMRTVSEVGTVVELFRRNYDRAPGQAPAAADAAVTKEGSRE